MPMASAMRPGTRQVSASLSATLFYVFGPVPLYFAAARGFGGEDVALGGFVAVFLTAGVFTAALSWWSRQPLALGWSLPGLLFIVAASREYSMEEVAGASLVASLAVLAMSLAGVVGRVERLIPQEVAMAVLAGSALGLCLAPFTALGQEPAVVAPTMLGFFAARAANVNWFPAAAGAVVVGLPAAILLGPDPGLAAPGLPPAHPLLPSFSADAVVALAPPLVVFVLIGNAQGRAVLTANGYEPPSGVVGAATGLMGAVHAVLGGPPASMQRVAMAVLTGDDAGERVRRWQAAVLAGAGCVVIAAFALPLDAFTASLHPAFVDAVIGLLLLKVLADALKRATERGSIAGPVAFCVAASSIALAGLTPEFWALAIGCAVAVFERVQAGRPAGALSSSAASPQNPPHLHPHLEGATPR